MKNDDELYHSFLSGDVSSYDELMIRYGDHLTFYLYGYLHSWQDAEDLMIDAFARLMVKKPRISDGKFKSYLFKTARNLASRFYKGKKKNEAFSFDTLTSEPVTEELVEDTLINEERRQVLHLCMGRLEPPLAEALWLVYFEDLTYAQAAAVMGINTKRVDHLLERAKKHLKAELAKEGFTNANE